MAWALLCHMQNTQQAECMNLPVSFSTIGPIAKPWRIVCDFDGTITPFDVTDAILNEFAHPSWEAVEREWLAGTISARECMERQVGLLNVPTRVLDAWLDDVPITDGFREFTRFCGTQGLDLVVVSDGLDYAIKRVLSRHGMRGVPVIANRLLCRGDSGYALAFPYGNPGCPSGVCKCGVAGSLGDPVLLIGDGRSDCCLAGLASLVLAKRGKELHRHCKEHAYSCLPFEDFSDVLAIFENDRGPWRDAALSIPARHDPSSPCGHRNINHKSATILEVV